MKGFRQFTLNENRNLGDVFERAKKISSYIKYDKYREMYIEALNELAAAAEQEEIYNARFTEHKTRLIRGIEYGYETFFDSVRQKIIDAGLDTSDLWSITTVADITKLSRLYSKIKLNIKEADEFFDSITKIPDALKEMKGYVKSGKPPAIPKPGQFIKPMASSEAIKLSKKYMEEVVASFRKELEKDIYENSFRAYDKIKDVTDPKNLKDASQQELSIASLIFISRGYGKNKTLELMKDAKKRVEKSIETTVENIVDRFVLKNAAKVANIIEKKSKVKTHLLLKTNVQNNMIENTMKFVFDDDSEFILESKVVYKMSKNQKYFVQYPTRFFNVKFSDGSKMSNPSEEKMIKEF